MRSSVAAAEQARLVSAGRSAWGEPVEKTATKEGLVQRQSSGTAAEVPPLPGRSPLEQTTPAHVRGMQEVAFSPGGTPAPRLVRPATGETASDGGYYERHNVDGNRDSQRLGDSVEQSIEELMRRNQELSAGVSALQGARDGAYAARDAAHARAARGGRGLSMMAPESYAAGAGGRGGETLSNAYGSQARADQQLAAADSRVATERELEEEQEELDDEEEIAIDEAVLAKLKKKLLASSYKVGRTTNVALIFKKADRDKSGGLDKGEFRRLCRTTARIPVEAMSDPEVNKIFEMVDADDSGLVDSREFSAWLSNDAKAEKKIRARRATKVVTTLSANKEEVRSTAAAILRYHYALSRRSAAPCILRSLTS